MRRGQGRVPVPPNPHVKTKTTNLRLAIQLDRPIDLRRAIYLGSVTLHGVASPVRPARRPRRSISWAGSATQSFERISEGATRADYQRCHDNLLVRSVPNLGVSRSTFKPNESYNTDTSFLLVVKSHMERRCSFLGPTQGRISLGILEYTKINFLI
jgi:hypothetical protein